MRLARLGPRGEEIPVLLGGDATYDLRQLTADIDGPFLAAGGLDNVRAVAPGDLPVVPDADRLRIGAPIVRPSAVVCVGMNYAAHAAESGADPPTAPIVFLKTPNTVVGPNDDLALPPGSTKTDWEVELGVVIGRRTAYLEPSDAVAAHIAGFVCANDASERRYQLEDSGGQWSKGKCCPGFTPTGPWLVTADAVDQARLRLRSWVNGAPRQDSTTADMIFGVEDLLRHLSQYMTFEPGDLLLTGTPQGVALSGGFPYLQGGDVLELEVEGLGRQRQRIVDTVP